MAQIVSAPPGGSHLLFMGCLPREKEATAWALPDPKRVASALERVAYTIPEFCFRNSISRPTYHRLRSQGRGPVEMRIGLNMIRITAEAEREWQRRMQEPQRGLRDQGRRACCEGRRAPRSKAPSTSARRAEAGDDPHRPAGRGSAMSDDPKILGFPKAEVPPEERARRLKTEVDELARKPETEWLYYLERGEIAKKHGVEPAALKKMIEATIKANEKKAREDKAEDRQRIQRAEKEQIKATRGEERARREQERADKEAVRKQKENRYDVIQASLVDTWAATAAGAYTLTENTLYTVEAFNDYLDHLTDDGRADDHALGVRRPAPRVAGAGGVRGARLGRRRSRLAIVQQDRVATFLLKRRRSPASEIAHAAGTSRPIWASTSCTRPTVAGADRGGLRPNGRRRHAHRRLRAADSSARPDAVLRRLPTGHPADDRRSPVLLSHHEARATSSGRVRQVDAVRQRPERAADADGHLGGARRCCSSSGRWC